MDFRNSSDLLAIAAGHADRFQAADPFPHIAFDGLFPNELLQQINDEIADVDRHDIWLRKTHVAGLKNSTNKIESVGPATIRLFEFLATPEFRAFLTALTGIDNLQADPALEGGGIHSIERDGFLKVHVDFNFHRQLEMYRRVNLLLYLNQDWELSYGGSLELWNADLTECVSEIPPLFNRCVIFNTSDASFHGHPAPLNCPLGMRRLSIAAYYYTRENGENVTESHRTHYTLTPDRAEQVA